ncbi:MAG: aspartate/glutamate racemase family protein [Candidatus Hodarchaeota archaeon]
MKTIGLLGGMSWESSLEYYRIINETVKELIGGLHSAKSIMYSYDFEEINSLQHQGKWSELSESMTKIAKKLEKAGAELIIICTNTMHKVADELQRSLSIPIIHIADATAEKIIKKKIQKVGLLGTKFTMEEGFYKDRLKNEYELDVIIPNKKQRQVIHNIIYKELVLGHLKEQSRDVFIEIIQHLKAAGAEGIILGCTEIPLLIKQADVDIPLFDTTTIHARSAVKYALDY